MFRMPTNTCRANTGKVGNPNRREHAGTEEKTMQTISRRHLLSGGATGLAALGYLSRGALELGADPLRMPIGCQTYPVRDALGKDFEGTLVQLAAIGYKSIEMCSPRGYERAGYG